MHPDMAYKLMKDRHVELTSAAERHRLLSSVSARLGLVQRTALRTTSGRYRRTASPARITVRPPVPAPRAS
jgi:hypothetical protein